MNAEQKALSKKKYDFDEEITDMRQIHSTHSIYPYPCAFCDTVATIKVEVVPIGALHTKSVYYCSKHTPSIVKQYNWIESWN